MTRSDEAAKRIFSRIGPHLESMEQRSFMDIFTAALDETTPTDERWSELQTACEPYLFTHPSLACCPQLYLAAVHVLRFLNMEPSSRPGKSSSITAAEVLFPDSIEDIMAKLQASKYQKHSLSRDGSAKDMKEQLTPSPDISTTSFHLSKALSARWNFSEKYSGSIDGTSFFVFRSDYMTAMKELAVPRTLQVQFLHHALRDDAKDYFMDKILQNGDVTQISDAFQLLEDKFLNDAAKSAIQSELISLRLSDIQKAHDLDKIDGLKWATKRILHLSGHCAEEYKNERSMIDVLEKHVLRGEPWSVSICALRCKEKYTLDSFSNTLCAYLQSLKEKGCQEFYLGRPSEHNQRQTPMALIHYGEQYNRSRMVQRPHPRKHLSQLPSRTQAAERHGRCHRCGKHGHWQVECPEKRSSHLEALRSRVRESGGDSNAIAKVLYETAQELDALELETSVKEDDHVDITADSQGNSSARTEYENFFLNDESSSAPGSQDFWAIPGAESRVLCLTEKPHRVASNKEELKKILLDNTKEFIGAAIDTGAERTVIGSRQAKAYVAKQTYSPDMRQSYRIFLFGDNRVKSCGQLNILMPTPRSVLSFYADIVPSDVPLLLGLDVLDHFKLQFLSVDNILEQIDENGNSVWRASVIRKNGHAYYCWNDTSYVSFNRSNLDRLHRHMYHPSSNKLLNLLKRVSPEKISSETKSLLEDIVQSCKVCQTFGARPISFQISTPDEVVFNQEVLLDLMFLDNRKPVLHVVDRGTCFQAASFLRGEDAISVWNAFLETWSNLYIGHPESILADQGSVFTSTLFEQLCAQAEIHLKHTGTESHNSLGAGEKYHGTLRTIYRKLSVDFPSVSDHTRLSCAVHAINTSMGPEGIIPCLLVFGSFPRLLSPYNEPFRKNSSRFKMMATAREEYASIVLKQRIQLGIRKIPPPAANFAYSPGDLCYVFREKEHHWSGPHRIVSIDGKCLKVDLGEATGPRSFNIAQTKPSLLSDETSYMGSLSNKNVLPDAVAWTQVLHRSDPRIQSQEMKKAAEAELLGLIDKNTFQLAKLSPLQQKHANIVPTKFVYSLKHEDGKVLAKARFCVGGHRDAMKGLMVHTSSTVRHSSVRLLLSLAAIFKLGIWTIDIKQAYLQSAHALKRDIYCKTNILRLNHDEYLKLVLPLYGLTESGDYWGDTCVSYHVNKLGLYQSKIDFSLYWKNTHNSKLFSAVYVDDILQAGSRETKDDVFQKISSRFECKPAKSLPFTFCGVRISEKLDVVQVDMEDHISRLQEITDQASFLAYSSLRAKLLWISGARPDVSAFSSFIGSVTSDSYSKADVKSINETVRHLKNTNDIKLNFHPLDVRSLHIVVYTDAGFRSRPNGYSQIGYIILLSDSSSMCNILSFTSRKCSRVAISSFAAETLAFSAGFDAAYTLKTELSEIMQNEIPLLMLCDSAALFDTLTKQTIPSSGRTMLDLHAAREAYTAGEINNIGLIDSKFNIADSLTKVKNQNPALHAFLRTNRITHPIRQYIVSASQA